TYPALVDRDRYLCCRGEDARSLVALGPYRRAGDPTSDSPLLPAKMESRAALALVDTTRAYSDLDRIRRERLELASQLEVVSSAVIAITGQLGTATVLQRIVDLTRELVGARYTALGVPNARGEMESFITSGMTPEEEEAI